jgi:hypothetical protein
MTLKPWMGAVVAGLLAVPAFAHDEPNTTTTTSTDPVKETETVREESTTLQPGSDGMVEEQRVSTTTVVEPDEDAKAKQRTQKAMQGVKFTVGGGVEGYSGSLAPAINPGPTWGARAAIQPHRIIGVELGYSGAVNEIDNGRGQALFMGSGATGGADIVRNGGEAVATVALTTLPFQPYLLGGVGMSWYDVRGGQGEGFSDDRVGNVPVGLGFRGHAGPFTTDARFNYNVLFDQQLADTAGGKYTATLNLGAAF